MDEDATHLWVEEMINHHRKSSPNIPTIFLNNCIVVFTVAVTLL